MNEDHDRDESIDSLLRTQLTSAEASEACLDADQLAAWVEGKLRGPELETAEAHLAECARCQSIVAAVGSMPAVTEPRPWWHWRRGAWWVVPATASAIAIAVWIGNPSPQKSSAVVSSVREDEKFTSLTSTAALAERRGEADRSGASASSADREGRLGQSSVRRNETKLERNTNASIGRAGKAREGDLAQSQNFADTLDKEAAAAAPGAARPAPPAPSTPAPPVGEASASTFRAGEAIGGVGFRTTVVARTSAAAVKEIVSPDTAIRWRIGASALVQYSTNGGLAWEVLPATQSTNLAAGASPAPSVCWLVGRAGTILMTTDGRNFKRINFPEPVDLSSVRAVDASTATVTATDGRQFTTSDSGGSWQPSTPR